MTPEEYAKIKKTITIEVSNEELDAMENLCTVDYKNDRAKKRRDSGKTLDVWTKLVREFDKDEMD